MMRSLAVTKAVVLTLAHVLMLALSGCAGTGRGVASSGKAEGAGLQPLYVLKGHSGGVKRILFEPMSNRLLSISEDGLDSSTMIFWNASTGKMLDSIPNGSFVDRDAEYSRDGTLLGIGSRTAFLLDASTLRLRRIFEPEIYQDLKIIDMNSELTWPYAIMNYKVMKRYHFVTALSFSPDGRYLVSGHDNARVKVWEINSGKLLNVMLTVRVFGSVIDVEFSPDGRFIAACQDDDVIHIWRFPDYRESELDGHEHRINDMEFNPVTGLLVSADDGGTVKIWDIDRGISIRTIETGGRCINDIDVSRDGDHIACGRDGGSVAVLDFGTGRTVAELPGSGLDVRSVALNSNSTLLAAGLEDGTVEIMDISMLELSSNIALTPVPIDPARLLCDAFVQDADGDGALERGEAGSLVISIENAGGGAAYNLVTQIRPEKAAAVSIEEEAPLLPMLLPGRTHRFELPIRAAQDFPAEGTELVIRVFESNGFHLEKPVRVRIAGE